MDFKAELIQRLNNKTHWDIPEITSLFIYYRQILEDKGLKGKFPVLNFFGNWVAHTSLTQSPVGYEMLENFNRVIIDSFSGNVPQDVAFNRIRDAFSLHKLKDEIEQLNALIGVKGVLTAHPFYFNKMCDLLLFILYDKQVSFPSDAKMRNKNQYFQNAVNYSAQAGWHNYYALGFKLSKNFIHPNLLAFHVEMSDLDGRKMNYLIPYVPHFDSTYV